tara:strand:+ start:790 stop:1095 length:306 start_codon:yes stop_codon:yes gene_type:complete
MENKPKTIYCGGGKKQNDTWFKVTINPDKIQDYIQEYNGSKFVKLNVNIKSEPDQFGKDVSISIDTWNPNSGQNSSTQNETKNQDNNIDQANNTEEDDLPF